MPFHLHGSHVDHHTCSMQNMELFVKMLNNMQLLDGCPSTAGGGALTGKLSLDLNKPQCWISWPERLINHRVVVINHV